MNERPKNSSENVVAWSVCCFGAWLASFGIKENSEVNLSNILFSIVFALIGGTILFLIAKWLKIM